MNSPEISPETTPPSGEPSPDALPPEPDSSMQDYYKLLQNLFVVCFVMTGVVFISVWIVYSLNIALNYLIGACTGVVYLRMLAKNVEQLGREKRRLSNTRLVLLIGLIIVASRWNQLQILPIFLGFLTYKAAVIFYMLKTAVLPEPNN